VTDPAVTATNVAEDHAHVDVQAAVVHGDINHFTVPADASPREKFETGVRLLESGVPGRAWHLINEAVMARHHTDEVFFYWLLALVSGRTRNELSNEQAVMLRNRQTIIRLTGDGAWADGVRTINRLLDFARKPDADIRVVLKEFGKLDSAKRAMILKHLEMFLEGPLHDQMWNLALMRAKAEQMSGDRIDRVWKFFQPDPARPRVRTPQSATISGTIWAEAVTATIVSAAAAVHIGYLLAHAGRIPALLAYLLIVPAGYIGARNGVEWCFRTVRRRAKDEEYGTPRGRRTRASSDGFARNVDRRFDLYFTKYAPKGVERQIWRAETAGIRKSMRDEIVETYREQRIGVERIAWLIRYQVRDVAERWRKGTLRDYQTQLTTPVPTKGKAVLGLAALAGGVGWAVADAVVASPLSAARSTALMLAGGWIAARAWLRVILERRRAEADASESEQALRNREAEFERWRRRLADKPADRQMAAWLDCDRKVLLDEVLRHYRLTMSNIIAYAFVEAGASARRARVRGGPWRYMRYQLLVFLLTDDGVRQLTVRLDFERGTFHDRSRANYRYEAIAAVRVRQADVDERTFELALVNGQDVKVQVLGPGMEELQEGESLGEVSEVTLDAAGLHHTLHVLEGIAAEGKSWIIREHEREEARVRNLTAATRGAMP
jgi:hypothetical protein